MPSGAYYIELIEKELAMARDAEQIGNEGKVRVCARRAAGRAVSWYLTKFPNPRWGTDAMRQLQHVAGEEHLPNEVKKAALRLTTKISDQFTYPFTVKPIDDAVVIIEYVKSVMGDERD